MFKQWGWLFRLGFVVLVAYFLARITNVYLATLLEVPRGVAVVSREAAGTPVTKSVGGYEPYQKIVDRNIFDASTTAAKVEPCGPDDPRPECGGGPAVGLETMPTTPPGTAVKTNLGIKVLSTLAVGDGKDPRSNSMIEGGGGKDREIWKVGKKSTQFPSATLVQVKPRRIEFMNEGRLEYAELQEAKSLIKTAGAATPPPATTETSGTPTGEQIAQEGEKKYVINQAELDAALSKMDELFTQIRVVPNFSKDGKADGMKILSIKPGSIFAKLGLRRGDVLHRINGQELDIKSGFQTFAQLREQRQFTVDLERSAKAETFEYEVR